MHEKLLNTIDRLTIATPTNLYNVEATKVYEKYKEDCLHAKCIIMHSKSSEIQRQNHNMEPTAIIEHLKKMYGGQSRTIRYQLSKKLFRSLMSTKDQVGLHALKMINFIEQLEKLECKLGKYFSQDLILQSLPESFS
ncbi:PREDICTED: uncharacterized protein LOC109361910 [Lupinus angustifolius]|uniref:uncharacterized protein LOC109361910 n=1 Tax=Lupinus angustifolius TaxID=3871 RepID=UPI00092F3530|nr:PREDICTED: uncharacterized protein LOC109361910 [Lupinus angustifolius]